MPTFDRAYFEALYAAESDPWAFRSSGYEHHKYSATIAALEGGRFQRCLELGCSIGVLTRRLLEHCDYVVAIDTSEQALAEARQYCVSDCVTFRQLHLPDGDLGRGYDLVVASEVLYYLERPALIRLSHHLRRVVQRQALLLAVHWTGTTNYPLTADEATRIAFEETGAEWLHGKTEPCFRLDVGRF
ncbi:class I SAM-dependent DNA methyltransferase [Dyella acidiphila]|uniref:Class I SAM-dependent methyltransferase n=1 Tax=Dyella acidiphila TaxID=2775866 RepID=A0ABR9GC20_9GAMM|nr:class I SAM-dependent methyltransferase [Dyella acidiphila]MBE1161559.1 class I SAM-dependent methyltransferase [Dyella acidiphila]